VLDASEVRALGAELSGSRDEAAEEASDRVLRELQAVMFAYDVLVWKHPDRLQEAARRIAALKDETATLAAPHTHELLRLKETEAMLLAAEIIIAASIYRTESRMSHFREDFDFRDDANWLCWVDVAAGSGGPQLSKTPIPTPLCKVGTAGRQVRRVVKGAAL
jgi:succinate dehydrogenase/fumarate reductase flavoprotein subunit